MALLSNSGPDGVSRTGTCAKCAPLGLLQLLYKRLIVLETSASVWTRCRHAKGENASYCKTCNNSLFHAKRQDSFGVADTQCS